MMRRSRFDPYKLYKEHFIDKQFERLALFQLLSDKFKIKSALYPGSFVHITPSFIIPNVLYVDKDKRANKFFNHPDVQAFIDTNKHYSQTSKFPFVFSDYREDLPLKPESSDLLISQYAGIVSKYCKIYLKKDGLLLVNNSHGDASMAFLDEDYTLQAVINHRNGKYYYSDKELETYFIPRKDMLFCKEEIEKNQRGIGYTRSASLYLFKRTQ